jgi:hypothetical protein
MEGRKKETSIQQKDKQDYPTDFAGLMLELGQLELRVKSRKRKLSPELEKELDESFDKFIQGIFTSYRASDEKWKNDLRLLRETAQEMEDIHTQDGTLPDEFRAPRGQRRNIFQRRINAFREKLTKMSSCLSCVNTIIETMESDFNGAYTEGDEEREKSCWNALIGFENLSDTELRNIENMMSSYHKSVKAEKDKGKNNNQLH